MKYVIVSLVSIVVSSCSASIFIQRHSPAAIQKVSTDTRLSADSANLFVSVPAKY